MSASSEDSHDLESPGMLLSSERHTFAENIVINATERIWTFEIKESDVEDAHDLHQIINTDGRRWWGHWLTQNKFDYHFTRCSKIKVSIDKKLQFWPTHYFTSEFLIFFFNSVDLYVMLFIRFGNLKVKLQSFFGDVFVLKVCTLDTSYAIKFYKCSGSKLLPNVDRKMFLDIWRELENIQLSMVVDSLTI